ncbi:MAG TPA: GNAT family N-acetyltransferase [Capsulimonadaceae bacterium]|jgi:ribosomal protein S18 acetylase RimI-like enzyme
MTPQQPIIELRQALVSDSASLAELTLLSGENLLTNAFGGNRRDALLAIECLTRTWGTMFSFQMATVASDASDPQGEPLGVVIAHPSSSERQAGQRLAEVIVRQRGLWRWLRMLPVSLALERCSEPIPRNVTYVSILAVVPDKRCAGIGTKLLRSAEQHAAQLGDNKVCLDVEVDNVRGIAFYERNGYRTVTEHAASSFLRSRGIVGLRRVEKFL